MPEGMYTKIIVRIRQILTTILAVVLLGQPCMGDYLQKDMRIPGSDELYRVRCSTDMIETPVSQQLDIAYYSSYADWVCITDRLELEGLLGPEELKVVTIEGPQGAVPAVVVWGEGATRGFVYVVGVTAPVSSLPRLQMLLSESHEGAEPSLRFDDNGNLISLTLGYAAMHMVDDNLFPGHILLERTYGWIPEEQKFRMGPLYVDTEAEKNLSLLEAITTVGSYRLGVFYTYDDSTKTSIRRFKPVGLLKGKLPEDLRSAPMVEVVVGDSRILEMKSVSDTEDPTSPKL